MNWQLIMAADTPWYNLYCIKRTDSSTRNRKFSFFVPKITQTRLMRMPQASMFLSFHVLLQHMSWIYAGQECALRYNIVFNHITHLEISSSHFAWEKMYYIAFLSFSHYFFLFLSKTIYRFHPWPLSVWNTWFLWMLVSVAAWRNAFRSLTLSVG